MRNLTTAASIWVSGAIGMAFGFNYYLVGVVAALFVAFVPRIPHINRMSQEALFDANVMNKKPKKKTPKKRRKS